MITGSGQRRTNDGRTAQRYLPLSVREQPSDGRTEGDSKEKHRQELSVKRVFICALHLLHGPDDVGPIQQVTVPVRCLVASWQIRHSQARGRFGYSRGEGQEEDDVKAQQEGHHKRHIASGVARTIFAAWLWRLRRVCPCSLQTSTSSRRHLPPASCERTRSRCYQFWIAFVKLLMHGDYCYPCATNQKGCFRGAGVAARRFLFSSEHSARRRS